MLYDPKWCLPEVKLEPWQKVLLAAIDILETKGWTRGSYGNDERGYCALGAMRKVYGLQSTDYGPIQIPAELQEAAKRLEKSVGHDIAMWNDASERTKKEVIETFREVIAAG